MARTSEWNVVVTAQEGGYIQTRALLRSFGQTWKTDYYNVLVVAVPDIGEFLQRFGERWRQEESVRTAVGHVSPVSVTFRFQNPAEFEARAREAAERFAPRLAGKRFHVRMHRRGFKGRLSSQGEERLLDEVLLEAAGESAAISFDEPQAIVVVETVGQQAGMALWSREEWERYPFLYRD